MRFAFQDFSQGFEYEHMVEEHDVLQSQERYLLMPLKNEELEPEFIQPSILVPDNSMSAPTTMESLLQQPLYKDCQLSALQTIILLLNLQTLHQWSNESMDDLLR